MHSFETVVNLKHFRFYQTCTFLPLCQSGSQFCVDSQSSGIHLLYRLEALARFLMLGSYPIEEILIHYIFVFQKRSIPVLKFQVCVERSCHRNINKSPDVLFFREMYRLSAIDAFGGYTDYGDNNLRFL